MFEVIWESKEGTEQETYGPFDTLADALTILDSVAWDKEFDLGWVQILAVPE